MLRSHVNTTNLKVSPINLQRLLFILLLETKLDDGGNQNLQLLWQQLFFQHLLQLDMAKSDAGQCHMLLKVQIFDSAGA